MYILTDLCVGDEILVDYRLDNGTIRSWKNDNKYTDSYKPQ
jgi:hypothetical protein